MGRPSPLLCDEPTGNPDTATADARQVDGDDDGRGTARRRDQGRSLGPQPAPPADPDDADDADDADDDKSVLRLPNRLHRSGTTIVVITHDPAVAVHSGRTVALRDGLLSGPVGA